MENKEPKEENKKEFVPPLEFSSIVFPFYSQALIELGVIEGPGHAQEGKNLELARRLIDILDLLKDRTKGNLETEEEKFLEACLQQLKMHYLEKAEAIKL